LQENWGATRKAKVSCPTLSLLNCSADIGLVPLVAIRRMRTSHEALCRGRAPAIWACSPSSSLVSNGLLRVAATIDHLSNKPSVRHTQIMEVALVGLVRPSLQPSPPRPHPHQPHSTSRPPPSPPASPLASAAAGLPCLLPPPPPRCVCLCCSRHRPPVRRSTTQFAAGQASRSSAPTHADHHKGGSAAACPGRGCVP
jgi:hypothetical protein